MAGTPNSCKRLKKSRKLYKPYKKQEIFVHYFGSEKLGLVHVTVNSYLHTVQAGCRGEYCYVLIIHSG